MDSIYAQALGLERLDSHRERLRMLSGTFRTVRGNCDSPWVFPDYGFALPPRYLVVDIGGRTLFLTHGDIYHDWRSSPVKLHNRDIFVTGHTHIARLSKFSDGPLLLNPGSASLPRTAEPPVMQLLLIGNRTQGIIHTANDGQTVDIGRHAPSFVTTTRDDSPTVNPIFHNMVPT